MFTTSTRVALAAASALGFAACGQSAVAQNADTVSVKVSYADLNTSSPAGARAMLQRIRTAAKAICGTESDDPLDQLMIYRPCVDGVTNRAVVTLDDPTVTAINNHQRPSSVFAQAGNR